MDANGTYFRRADPKHQVGESTDAGSWRKPWKVKGPHFGAKGLCGAHGISLFADLAVLKSAREASAWARSKSIAEVDLEPSMGKTLETPSEVAREHHDWWTTPYKMHPAATVIEAKLGDSS